MTADDVRQMVAITRERGWSLNVEDLTPGVSSIGVALPGFNGSGLYAISVAGLAARFQGNSLNTTADAVMAAVSRVAAQIDVGH
jgi:DNA-binding IclR family transcriptional regulator